MSFITEDSTVISFAEYRDVIAVDQRLFDSNEGLTDDVVETALIRATERILSRIRSSAWWQKEYTARNSVTNRANIPNPDPNKVKARENDFTELCVYLALADYVLPQVANFGDEGDDDRNKMGYYQNRMEQLYAELIEAGDWYDWDGDAVVESDEKNTGQYNLRRYR